MYLCLFANIYFCQWICNFGMQLSCLHQTKPKKKKNNKTWQRIFGLELKDCFFGVSLRFLFFFWFWNRKNQKRLVFFCFSYLMEVKTVQKNKKNTMFFFVFHQKLCPKPNLKFWKTKKKLCFFGFLNFLYFHKIQKKQKRTRCFLVFLFQHQKNIFEL